MMVLVLCPPLPPSLPCGPQPTEESDVLEIGFGCGYSADRIQESSPRTHTIIEPDPVVLARLHDWAEKRQGVQIVEGFWQTALPTLGKYDAVFFDDFPVSTSTLYFLRCTFVCARFRKPDGLLVKMERFSAPRWLFYGGPSL